MSSGAAAINIIPDRNYTPGVKDQKLQNLYDVVALAEKHHFPVIVGTEMNAPGNKFVDEFEHGGIEAAGAGLSEGRAHRLCPFRFAARKRPRLFERLGEKVICKHRRQERFLREAGPSNCSPRRKTVCAACRRT